MKSVSNQVQPLLKQNDSNSESISPAATQCGENENVAKPGSPLPRPKRRRKRSKADRGLPDDAELARLATAYLDKQRKLWPKLADAGLLPGPSPEVIHQTVDDFKERHRGTAASPESLQQFKTFCAKLAGSYNRFSCDNSNPTSILDQLSNALDKAKAEERFVPWAYVYADYSVTGLVAARQGYSSYKDVLRDRNHLIETTYIDDFTRASRDELEWWKLAALSRRLNRRLIGASDGFDVHSPHVDLEITMYGLLSRLFLKGLREKVRRGMAGAAERGNCLGKLPLGFTRQQKLDVAGNLMLGADQLPVYEPVIDPQTRHDLQEMFRLFVEEKFTPFMIARNFNDRKVDDWDRWSDSNIKGLLRNPSAIGVFIWNKTHSEFDWEEEEVGQSSQQALGVEGDVSPRHRHCSSRSLAGGKAQALGHAAGLPANRQKAQPQ